MKYLCLVYIEEKKLDAMSQSESDALIDESLAYDEVLRKSGHYLVSGVHDRRSLLGRFILINARDMSDAIQVASQIPVARLGRIEVRPILELEQQ